MTKIKYPIEVYESYLPQIFISGHYSQECVDKYVDWRICLKDKSCNGRQAKHDFDSCISKNERRINNNQIHFAANVNTFHYRKNPISNNIW